MEKFFYISQRYACASVLDLILKRYSNIEFINALPIEEAVELIDLANEAEGDELLYRQWLAQIPGMMISGDETYAKFSDFRTEIKSGAVAKQMKKVTADEALETAERILNEWGGPDGI